MATRTRNRSAALAALEGRSARARVEREERERSEHERSERERSEREREYANLSVHKAMKGKNGKGKRESVRPRNFMSMSDDEEEEEGDEMDVEVDADNLEDNAQDIGEKREGGRLLSVLCE